MKNIKLSKTQWILLLGDIAAIFLTVAAGFQNHETVSIFFQRFAFTFVPWTLAWLLIAPKFDLFSLPFEGMRMQMAKIIYAMLLASPLAVVLRAAWLGSAALPLFALIMGASSALALVIWRLIFAKWIGYRDA